MHSSVLIGQKSIKNIDRVYKTVTVTFYTALKTYENAHISLSVDRLYKYIYCTIVNIC